VIKARSKKLSLLLVFMMLATLFIGVGTASASTTNVALTVPAVGTDGDVVLGTLKITEDDSSEGSITAGQQVTINLPTGVKYASSSAVDAIESATGDNTTSDTLLAPFVSCNNYHLNVISASTKSLTVEIGSSNGTDAEKTSMYFYFGGNSSLSTTDKAKSKVTLDGPDSDISVEVYAQNSGITQGKVVVATSSSKGTTTTVLDTNTISNSSKGQELGTIRIAENRAGSVGETDKVKVVAPDDVTIESAELTASNWKIRTGGTGTTSDPYTYSSTKTFNDGDSASGCSIGENSDGRSQLLFYVDPTTSGETPGFVNIILTVSSDDDDVTGDLTFTVKGDNVTTQSVALGTVGDYAATVEADGDPLTVKAGASNQDIQDLKIQEQLKGSFLKDRDIELELPDYAHWYDTPTLTKDSGAPDDVLVADDEDGVTVDSQRHSVKFTVDNTSTTKVKYTFEDMSVFLDADAPAGDLTMTVGGDALDEDYTVVLAKVVTPVTATATPTNVSLGVSAQDAGDLTITEADAGMLKAQVTEIPDGWDDESMWGSKSESDYDNQSSKLIVGLPDGVTFDSTPTVTVTSGDLEVKEGSVKLTNDDQYLEIPIDSSSTVASTITVSGIKLTVDRTVPQGAINAKLFGNALDQVQDSDEHCYDAITKTAIATAVTPADATASYTSSFVIGASSYTLNGATVDAVAPSYIKNSRTYLAIRDVAHALGISDSNVLWDGTKNTVTLIKGDKVVQMTVGSTTLTVNGASVTMDVAPEITASRTFLPAAWLAQAFGSTATFDSATQTVTIN